MLTIRIDYRRGRPTLAPGGKEEGGGLLRRTIVLSSVLISSRGTCASIMLFIIWEELEIFLESRLEIIERPRRDKGTRFLCSPSDKSGNVAGRENLPLDREEWDGLKGDSGRVEARVELKSRLRGCHPPSKSRSIRQIRKKVVAVSDKWWIGSSARWIQATLVSRRSRFDSHASSCICLKDRIVN